MSATDATSRRQARVRRLPAEWEAQDGIMLTWPHGDSDWAPWLEEIEAFYLTLLRHLLHHSHVLLSVHPSIYLRRSQQLARCFPQHISTTPGQRPRLFLYPCDSDDTWTRDYGPIGVYEGDHAQLLDFQFNGWGEKFSADKDNAVNRCLQTMGAFRCPMIAPPFCLEGGAIDCDGVGSVLTTSSCLLSPKRNPQFTQAQIEQYLKTQLGVHQVHWLDHGYLAGDDTDGHIDTLARFAPNKRLCYVKCDDSEDEHFPALAAMEAQLQHLRTLDGDAYTLIPLPWPPAQFDADGRRLPATYANFLITNHCVIVPTYAVAEDARALQQIQSAFPHHRIIGLDCRCVIRQFGSLHCLTMQLPAGILNTTAASLTTAQQHAAR